MSIGFSGIGKGLRTSARSFSWFPAKGAAIARRPRRQDRGLGRCPERPVQAQGPAVLERVGKGDFGMDPLEAEALEPEPPEERRREGQRLYGGADVVDEAGSVSSAERAPPPMVSFASTRRTDLGFRFSVMAAASPLGPAPTTTAS